MSAATLSASSTVISGAVVPGTMGTPAAFMSSRLAVLLPMASMALGGGPIHTSPAADTARAKSAFSLRNPYPG